MGLVNDLSAAQIAFQLAGGEADRFVVTRYRGDEGISRLYHFEIDLVARESDVNLDEIIRQPAVLTIETAAGPRLFHGMINRFELIGETTAQTYYRAHLVPREWLLTQRYQSRIFQNKTVPAIVLDVLAGAGMDTDRVIVNIEREFKERIYCVQYRETDYNFICRLMEEEGIWWRYEQADDGARLVLIDDSTRSYPPIGTPSLPYRAPGGFNMSAADQPDHVFAFRAGRSINTDSVRLADFNFEKSPAKDMFESFAVANAANLPWHDFPGGYGEEKRGTELATIRAQELDSRKTVCSGRSNCSQMACGHTFGLTDHPNSNLNREYLITALIHEGRQSNYRTFAGDSIGHQGIMTDSGGAPGMAAYWQGQVATDPANTAAVLGKDPFNRLGLAACNGADRDTADVDLAKPVYECRFECVPADLVYRPARITAKPLVRGTQTARVVGPDGEEIHTDKYGRVKVQFHWDADGGHGPNASCWIRVSQGLAGGAYGMMFLPRVGQEVVVDFLEGDPDQPIIIGRVYNADHMPPYELPKEKTKSTIKTHSSTGGEGSNEIRFEDAKGKEQLFLHAEKDLHLRAKNDSVEAVGHDLHLHVGNDRFERVIRNLHLHVKDGYRRQRIGGNDDLAVSGQVSIDVRGTHSTHVVRDVVEQFDANHKHEVVGTYGSLARHIKLEATAGLELKCGKTSIVLTPSTIFVVGGPMVKINSGSGPAVQAVKAKATKPTMPEDPAEADKNVPGKDTRYDRQIDPSPAASRNGHAPKPAPVEKDEDDSSWIEIELVDDHGQPMAGEPYQVKTSSGRLINGSLDANGLARVTGIKPGQCEICFPKRDAELWQRV